MTFFKLAESIISRRPRKPHIRECQGGDMEISTVWATKKQVAYLQSLFEKEWGQKQGPIHFQTDGQRYVAYNDETTYTLKRQAPNGAAVLEKSLFVRRNNV